MACIALESVLITAIKHIYAVSYMQKDHTDELCKVSTNKLKGMVYCQYCWLIPGGGPFCMDM